MNKSLIISFFLIGAFFMQIPSAFAWDYNTHQEIVQSNYNALPSNIQQNLDINALKQGSIDPDFKFFDFKNHYYPNSYFKAEEWLNKGQQYYKNGNYYYASYCYGVASHYIADSFSAPHCANISGPYHTLYEAQASFFLKPEFTPINSNEDLKSMMIEGQSSGKYDWNQWMNTKNNSYIQNDLNTATDVSYYAIYTSINNSNSTDNKKENNSNYSISLLSIF